MSAKFRLAAVERLRAARVLELARALGAATLSRDEALGRKQFLTEQLNGPTAAQRYDNAQQLMSAAWFRERLRTELIAVEGEIIRRTELLETTRGEWTVARAQLKAVESLHDRHRAAVRAEQFRLEQREVDDLAGTGAARSMAGAGGDDR